MIFISKVIRRFRRLYRRLLRYRDHVIAQQKYLDLMARLDSWEGRASNVRRRDRLATLWRSVRTLPKHLRRPLYTAAERLVYEAADAIVAHARAPAPQPFHFQSSGFFRYPSGASVPCYFRVDWAADRGVRGWHRPSTTSRSIADATPGKILEGDGVAESTDGDVTVHRIVPAPWPTTEDPMVVGWDAVARVKVLSSEKPIVTTRYIYRGISIPGLSEFTVRREVDDVGEVCYPKTRDSLEVRAFGRRARVTQISRSTEESILSVTFAGTPLEKDLQDVLWHAVSFMAGGRAQLLLIDCREENGAPVQTEYQSSIVAGPCDYPPFGPYQADMRISLDAFESICDGMAERISEGYPLGIALHHLHDANSGYYLVDLRNSLLCIHTLFEAWADIHHLRKVISDGAYRKYRKALQMLATAEISDEELRWQVHTNIQFGNHRSAEAFEVALPAFLGVHISDVAYSGLKRRNDLVHKGWVPHNEAELQQLLDERRATRSLANAIIARLCGYEGPLFDYERFEYSGFETEGF